jgi:Peptidase family M28
VTNLVATLRGTQPESADRVYVVSGHYDSRCTDVLNFTCDAPGADDDASGVAAVLELARVMAKRQFDATIVFMAVAGEEQNLFGSTFFAQQAKAAGMDVEGMFTNDIIGSSTSDKGRRDPFPVRLFSEGVPTAETPQQAALRQSIGGENDGPSRQLARYVKEVGENSATGMHVRLVWRRDRFLRGGDQIPFLQQGPMLYMLRFDITQPAACPPMSSGRSGTRRPRRRWARRRPAPSWISGRSRGSAPSSRSATSPTATRSTARSRASRSALPSAPARRPRRGLCIPTSSSPPS